MPIHRPRPALGFSLVELMIVVSLIGVISVIAAPSLGDFISDLRISTKTNDMLAFLNTARSEAARRGTRVTICISGDQATCTTSGTDWATGAVAFVDVNGNGQVDSGDTVLRVLDTMPPNFSVTATTAFATNYYFYYRPSGAASSTGTLRVCRTGRKARDISVSQTGRPMSTMTSTTC